MMRLILRRMSSDLAWVALIPSLVDQDRYAQSRDPIEMIVQGKHPA